MRPARSTTLGRSNRGSWYVVRPLVSSYGPEEAVRARRSPSTTDLLTIGRNPESHLFLDDVTVSRHHARIVRDATGFVAEDMNSLNGTYVNRRRVERHHLSDGDELQIGKFKLAYLEPPDYCA